MTAVLFQRSRDEPRRPRPITSRFQPERLSRPDDAGRRRLQRGDRHVCRSFGSSHGGSLRLRRGVSCVRRRRCVRRLSARFTAFADPPRDEQLQLDSATCFELFAVVLRFRRDGNRSRSPPSIRGRRGQSSFYVSWRLAKVFIRSNSRHAACDASAKSHRCRRTYPGFATKPVDAQRIPSLAERMNSTRAMRRFPARSFDLPQPSIASRGMTASPTGAADTRTAHQVRGR